MTENKKFFLLAICFFTLFSALFAPLFAQEAAQEAAQTEEQRDATPLTPERQRIEMEIITSTLPELAVWCRSLGLAENGTREELSRRLREHFELPEKTDEEKKEEKIITINSAQTTEYFRIGVIDEEYARLRGDVNISLKDGNSVHTISAEEIVFNRTRNTLTARGGVVYARTAENDGTVETFRGENITVNIDTWAAVFMDGDTERSIEGGDTAYKFAGTVISRTGEDATIIKDAVITNAATEEPYWSINASRLWLLPGSDFAVFNALLKVGEIPVLYLPFLYYPADELVFHPVIGYRSREGGFLQTTTYILGRPKANPDEQNSITKILGASNDMEKELEGIFLRSSGKKAVNRNEPGLRLLLDHYVNLGTYAGLEFSLPSIGLLRESLILDLGIGYSRTVSMHNGNWTPYAPNFDGEFDWNHSMFFSEPVPFRYKMHFKSGIGFRYGSLSWDIPYYSDSRINDDFLKNRAESMDWLSFLQRDLAGGSSASSSAMSLGAPQWTLHGNFTPNMRALNPYINSFTISTLSSSLNFKSLTDSSIANINSPAREFFAPDTYTIYNISASISGAPLTIGRQSAGAQNENNNQYNPAENIGNPKAPWQESAEDGREGSASSDFFAPPPLNVNFTLPGDGNLVFKIDYNIRPASSSALQFRSGYNNWKRANEVNWNEVQSILTSFTGSADLNFRLDHSNGLFSNTFSISGLGDWRDYAYLNENAEAYLDSYTGLTDPDKVTAAKQQQYSQTRYATSYSYNGTIRPFLDDSIFNRTNFQYNFRGALVNSKRYNKDNSPYGPELTPVWGSWAKDQTNKDIYGLKDHRLSSNLSAALFNQQQTLNLRSDLPPLDPLISTEAIFRIWITETKVDFIIRRAPEDAAVKPGEWIYNPVNITETLKFNGGDSFIFNMVITPEEENEITRASASLSLFNSGFRASFIARKTPGAEFIYDEATKIGRWKDNDSPVLQPERLSFSYNHNFNNNEITGKFLNFSVNLGASLNYDLIKHTNSNFDFSLGFKFLINKFIDIELTATSNNSVIFRYFKNVPGMENLTFMYPEGPQNNLFEDLFDSFNFLDDAKRRRAGFKMKSFDLKITHYLGDWEAVFSARMHQYLNNSLPLPKYETAMDFSFLVQWKPIAEIKTNLKYEERYDKWSIE